MPTIWDAFLNDIKKNKIDLSYYSLREILEIFWNYNNNPFKYEKWLSEHK
jgi:hypothetical protein